jgi:hypothetical protein
MHARRDAVSASGVMPRVRAVSCSDGFRSEEGRFIYRLDGQDCYAAIDIGIGFTRDRDGSCIVHKHGPVAEVNAWADQTRQALSRSALPASVLGEVCVVSSDRWATSDLEQIISCSGFLERFLARSPAA